jgi:hypothetical protein
MNELGNCAENRKWVDIYQLYSTLSGLFLFFSFPGTASRVIHIELLRGSSFCGILAVNALKICIPTSTAPQDDNVVGLASYIL